MSTPTESRPSDPADESSTPRSPQESLVSAELDYLDGLAIDELRAMPSALVQILAAVGC